MNPRITPAGFSLRATGRFLAVAVVLCAWPGVRARAAGGNAEEARAYFDKASASFALGHYPAAAENYEKAFEAKPDSALLYNAAQAHRLAGNKERALTLYQNYLRIYPRAPRRAEVETRIDELKKALAQDREAAAAPPPPPPPPTPPPTPTPPPMAATEIGAAPVEPAPATPPPERKAVDLDARPPAESKPEASVATRVDASRSQPLTSKPLFWAAVGGGIVAVMSVILVVALSGAKDPSASLGVVR